MAEPTHPEPPETSPRPSRLPLPLVGRVLGIVIVLGALGASAVAWRLSDVHPRTDDAAVRANIVGIAPHVNGPIVELHVVDNQRVKAGDLLFVVDARPYEARLARVGPNVPFAEEEESVWEEILELFREPMILLLIAVMVVYFLLGEHEDALIMLGAIVPIVAHRSVAGDPHSPRHSRLEGAGQPDGSRAP